MNLLKRIFSIKKLEFLFPKKNKILFIGNHNVDLFEKNILKNCHTICELNSINIWVFILSLFRKYSDKLILNYYINFIKFTEPKLVITFLDNYYYFYLLKNFFIKEIFISIQNGWRGSTADFFDRDMLKKFKELKSDYILTFNDAIGDKFKQHVDCNNLTIGSFRSNLFKINKPSKVNSLAFISSFRKKEISGISYKDYFLSDKYIVNFLSKYCKENSLKFFILPCQDGNDEYNYYSESNIDVNILPKKNRYCSYEYIDQFKHVFGTDTSLGYESLFRGNRVGFFNIRKNFITNFNYAKKMDDHNFLWPKKLQKEGPFWTHDKDINSIKRVVDFVVNSSDIEWKQAFSIIDKENYIVHNYKNTILKDLIYKNLKHNA